MVMYQFAIQICNSSMEKIWTRMSYRQLIDLAPCNLLVKERWLVFKFSRLQVIPSLCIQLVKKKMLEKLLELSYTHIYIAVVQKQLLYLQHTWPAFCNHRRTYKVILTQFGMMQCYPSLFYHKYYHCLSYWFWHLMLVKVNSHLMPAVFC